MPAAYLIAEVEVTDAAQYERTSSKRLHSSSEYTEARVAREGAALMRMIVVEAVD